MVPTQILDPAGNTGHDSKTRQLSLTEVLIEIARATPPVSISGGAVDEYFDVPQSDYPESSLSSCGATDPKESETGTGKLLELVFSIEYLPGSTNSPANNASAGDEENNLVPFPRDQRKRNLDEDTVSLLKHRQKKSVTALSFTSQDRPESLDQHEQHILDKLRPTAWLDHNTIHYLVSGLIVDQLVVLYDVGNLNDLASVSEWETTLLR